ncbi:MAG: class I SAM-dependent RNA methyltransferase [Kiritimatiellia bacterium]
MSEIVTVPIHDIAYGGDGVGKWDGMAVFVRGALPGEQVTVQITERKKKYAKAALRGVDVASPSRIQPACGYAATCPGCAYQHVDYQQEVAWKQQQLQSLLQRVGGITAFPVSDPIASPQPVSYRNKIVMHAGQEGAFGYFGLDNRTVGDISDCPLAVEPIREALHRYRHDIPGKKLSPGDRVTFRWTQADGVISWRNESAPAEWLTESVNGQTWQVPAAAFWQVNPMASGLLLTQASRMIASCAPQYLIDLYCGSGFFGLALADSCQSVLGVEIDKEAIRAAKANASQRGCDGVALVQGDAARLYPQAQSQVNPRETCVLVDPPRSGLSQALLGRLVRNDGPAHILYVSCAADTLARDCKVLCGAGFQITDLQLVDMFPRTAHFETLALLTRQ